MIINYLLSDIKGWINILYFILLTCLSDKFLIILKIDYWKGSNLWKLIKNIIK